jgi:Xaa-Pro aminopeptidase
VPDVLIYGDTVRSPELRHEVPLVVPDPFLYLERDGRRVVALHSLEIPRVREEAPGIEIVPLEELGQDELYAQGLEAHTISLELCLRACKELGISAAAAPPSFPLELGDHLRANGVELAVDRNLFDGRRRSKNETELRGIRNAQKACEAALDRARELFRRAEGNDGLTVDGEPLTSERVKREIEDVFADFGVEGSDMIVSHGPQTAVGHDQGSGQIRANEPIVFDLFPRDKETGCYADMTRTYVIGEPSDEVKEWYTLVKEALERSTAAVKPGENGRALFEIACDIFHNAGYKTQLNKEPGEVLEDGFFHSLGHGVGLEVHELPWMGRIGHDLVPGDVITIEPGLYRAGYGGLRLEDVVLVTEDGHEVITDYPYVLHP